MVKCKNCANLVCDWCDMKTDSPDPDMERECHWFAHATNYDRVMSKTLEDLAEWFWWMLRYVQGYTDSRVALLDWLRQEVPDDKQRET